MRVGTRKENGGHESLYGATHGLSGRRPNRANRSGGETSKVACRRPLSDILNPYRDTAPLRRLGNISRRHSKALQYASLIPITPKIILCIAKRRRVAPCLPRACESLKRPRDMMGDHKVSEDLSGLSRDVAISAALPESFRTPRVSGTQEVRTTGPGRLAFNFNSNHHLPRLSRPPLACRRALCSSPLSSPHHG